ncbi:MAG: SUMF1/EgtB/PvdO family nonheme iron enzyme [bacterium]|nr:SUMF1/EgtB/PvdO family nonheme iron enzyme [bacterium]
MPSETKRRNSLILKQMTKVLRRPELRLGRNHIVPASVDITETEFTKRPLEFFEARTQALEEEEVVALIAVPKSAVSSTQEHVALLTRNVPKISRYHKIFLVSLEHDKSKTARLDESRSLTKIDPDGLFRMLASFPTDLANLLVQAARPDEPDEIEFLYQKRTARVLNDPEELLPVGHEVGLESYLSEWATSSTPRGPILLVGERGTGKTWEILRFCTDQYERHLRSRWEYGPALFVKIRGLRNFIEDSGPATPLLQQYLLSNYEGLSFCNDFTMQAAFLSSGHTITCLDGFDEMDLMPGDKKVHQNLFLLLNMISNRSRFLITSRRSHFGSLTDMLQLETWSGSTVRDSIQVLEILPFMEEVGSYLDSVRTSRPGRRAVADVISLLIGEADVPEINGYKVAPGLKKAFKFLSRHPSLLSHIRQLVESKQEDIRPIDLLSGAIEGGLITYNIKRERTLGRFYQGDDMIELTPERRATMCQEIAWLLAERGRDQFDIARMSGRMEIHFGIKGDVLERDLRSQTTFELADPLAESRQEVQEASDGSRSVVRFLLHVDGAEGGAVSQTSVTGAYFVARYLATRLSEQGPFGLLPLSHKLRYLGRVPLGQMAGSILAALLPEGSLPLEDICREIGSAAERGTFELFSPWYRYLFPNLVDMGRIKQSLANDLDPWSTQINEIFQPPKGIPHYALVLVPTQSPFVIGVHEITNMQYERFTSSEEDWRVETMTRAASGEIQPPSRFSELTNEYHLYFWEKQKAAGVDRFSPPLASGEHPVTWVSWYAAAAFCDWLSEGEGRVRQYRERLKDKNGRTDPVSADKKKVGAYRLPTAEEWQEAAKGGHSDLEYPWEMFPFFLNRADRLKANKVKAGHGDDAGVNRAALDYYLQYQKIMKKLLVDSSKETKEVMYDEFNDYGISGLIGNVREWTDDSSSERDQIILGSSGYLDERSFRFDYNTPLFPENTNPDVGFRIARSLDGEETESLRARQSQIRQVALKLADTGNNNGY